MIYLLILLLIGFQNPKFTCTSSEIYEVSYLDDKNDIISNIRPVITGNTVFELISSYHGTTLEQMTHLRISFFTNDTVLERIFFIGDLISIESETLNLEKYIFYDSEHSERYIFIINKKFEIVQLYTHSLGVNSGIKVTCND